MSTDESRRPIRRALISVYDKTGLIELSRGLNDAGVEIVSTGSTAKTIAIPSSRAVISARKQPINYWISARGRRRIVIPPCSNDSPRQSSARN